MNPPPDILLFFGRFHPLLVHLPIGLIVLVAFLELLARSRRFKNAGSAAGVVLALAVPCAAFSALFGWLLSLAGGYDDQILQWHKWTGIGTAAACAVAGLLYLLNLKKLYRFSLWLTMAALVVASHFGGSLTHGSDYLVRYAPKPLRALLGAKDNPQTAQTKPKDFAQMPVFASLIQPVLQQDCVSCHGPNKSKADLRLDSLAALLKGGKSGPAIVPGKSADSDLLRRLHLPSAEEDHMPPEGKPQPSPDDIALLQWWIDAGAPADKKVADLKPSASINRILAARSGSPVSNLKSQIASKRLTPAKPLSDILTTATKLGDEFSIAISALSPSENWLQCNASVAGTNFGDAELARLAPIGANLRWLDLAGTRITDAGLAPISAMPNLIRLHLERTAITDSGLGCLASLPELEYLDLYGTAVTDAGIESLQKLPKLKQLYLWQTKVTPAAAKSFTEARVDKDQLQQWQDEIENLKAKIRERQVSVELGVTMVSASMTNAAAANTNCPVSGKPIDASKTAFYNGVLVAFCCDDCKAKFQQDPKPFLAKLGLSPKPVKGKKRAAK